MKKNVYSEYDYGSRRNRAKRPVNNSSKRLIKISRTLSLNQTDRLRSERRLQSTRTKSIQITTHRRKILLIFSAIIAVIILIYFCIMQLTANFQITINESKTSQTIDSLKYKKALEDYVNDNALSRIRTFLDKDSMSEFMLIKYPEVLSVSDRGKSSLFDTTYQFTFRKPVAKLKMENTTYFVDSNGISFENNYFEEPDLNIIDNSGIKLEKGEAIVSNKFLKFVGRLVEEALNKGYFITEAIIPPEKTREVDIKLKGRGTIIKLAVDREVTSQIEDMNRALLYMDKIAIEPSYIDIRISGKAFYK